jgi:hypothetical protein
MNIMLVAALVFSSLVAASAQPSATIGPPMSCSNSQSAHGVMIQSCTYTLESSPAGNANYFVNVTIKYRAPNATSAVRFRCTLGSASTKVQQYGVLRQSGSTLKFVSPFVSSASALQSVACAVDAT